MIPVCFTLMAWRRLLLVYIVSNITCSSGAPQGNDALDFQRNLPAEVVWTVSGEDAELPCDMSVPPGDRVNMVLWFKDTTGIPLYSLDARGGEIEKAIHWAISDELGARSYFMLSGSDRDRRARLRIHRVSEKDEGVFRCRVDFFNSPTKNYRVNLTLVVPPSTPQILDAHGNEVATIAGPFLEGYDLQMSCHVAGGRPSPKVSWWHEGNMIDSISESTSDILTVNRLFLSTVPRSLHGSHFECHAKSIDRMSAVIRRVALEVFLKPLNVKIVSPHELLSAKKSRQLLCESNGSYPPARVTWLLDGEPIRHAATMVSTFWLDSSVADGENSTISTLTLRPDVEDDGKELACRAENLKFPGGIIEDRRYIRVAYQPIVSVTVGSDVDPNTLREGDDVRLTCEVKSNPEYEKISWYHKNELVSREDTGRVLHLRGLTRASAGDYVCVATNREGTSSSRPVPLYVQFAPVCKAEYESVVIGALRHETLVARCEVLADPGGDSLKFSWTYSKAKDVLPVPSSRVISHGHTSTLQYTPVSEGDFGTLACWASNPVGGQQKPCLTHIVHARAPQKAYPGTHEAPRLAYIFSPMKMDAHQISVRNMFQIKRKTPDPPQECDLRNNSIGRLEVECVAGSDGGLPQHFILEVCEADKLSDQASPGSRVTMSAPLYRMQEIMPRFTLHSLEPGNEYRLLVYAKNAMGYSNPPVVMSGIRVTTAMEKLTREDDRHSEINESTATDWSNTLLAAVIVGAVAIVCGVVVIAIILAMCKEKHSHSGLRNHNLDTFQFPSRSVRHRDSNAQIEDEGG